MKFCIKDFFSKCDQIRSFLRIWSHLLKKSLMENFIYCAVIVHAYFHPIMLWRITELRKRQKNLTINCLLRLHKKLCFQRKRM